MRRIIPTCPSLPRVLDCGTRGSQDETLPLPIGRDGTINRTRRRFAEENGACCEGPLPTPQRGKAQDRGRGDSGRAKGSRASSSRALWDWGSYSLSPRGILPEDTQRLSCPPQGPPPNQEYPFHPRPGRMPSWEQGDPWAVRGSVFFPRRARESFTTGRAHSRRLVHVRGGSVKPPRASKWSGGSESDALAMLQ